MPESSVKLKQKASRSARWRKAIKLIASPKVALVCVLKLEQNGHKIDNL